MAESEHGMRGYRKGCRCFECKKANTARSKAGREARRRVRPLASRMCAPGNEEPAQAKQNRAPHFVVELTAASVPERFPHASERRPAQLRDVTESKTEAQIEEIYQVAGAPRWDAECEALEHMALSAARAIDAANWDGRITATVQQWKILREAVRELRQYLAPSSARAVAEAEEDSADLFLLTLHRASVHCQSAFPEIVRGACSDCDRAPAARAEYARRNPDPQAEEVQLFLASLQKLGIETPEERARRLAAAEEYARRYPGQFPDT